MEQSFLAASLVPVNVLSPVGMTSSRPRSTCS